MNTSTVSDYSKQSYHHFHLINLAKPVPVTISLCNQKKKVERKISTIMSVTMTGPDRFT